MVTTIERLADDGDAGYSDRDLSLPPHSSQAEVAVLGSIIKEPGSIARITLPEAAFYEQRNRHVFGAMRALFDRLAPIDYQTICDELQRRGTYEAAGGLLYLSEIDLATPSAAHIEHYAAIVQRTATMRSLIAAAQTIAETAYRDNTDEETAIGWAERLIQNCRPMERDADMLTPEQWSDEFLADLNARMVGQRTAVYTGWDEIDEMLGGLEAQRLYMLLGTTGTAKSEISLQIATYVGRKHGPVLFASLEMSAVELAQRWMRIDNGVDRNKLASGRLDDDTLALVAEAAGRMAEGNVYPVCPRGSYTTARLQHHARRLVAHTGKRLGLIVTDYLQLLDDKDGQDAQAWENIELTSRNLKRIAREFNCPVLAPVQPTSDYKNRPEKEPRLTDVRGGNGPIAAADVVLGLYRPSLHEEGANPNELRWYMLKNRSGVGDPVPNKRTLYWQPSRQRYVDPRRAADLPWVA
jgi:replicative DNA helicase